MFKRSIFAVQLQLDYSTITVRIQYYKTPAVHFVPCTSMPTTFQKVTILTSLARSYHTGSPVDAVLVALDSSNGVLPHLGLAPVMLVSGPNYGPNISGDVYYRCGGSVLNGW